MECDIIIENGLLLTMDAGFEVIENGSVLIHGGEIKACGKSADFSGVQAGERIDASDRIIMPGLVNAHTHAAMSMFRGLADDLPLDVWLNEHIFPAEAKHVNPESVKKWTAHSCEEMLLSGTTTCCDGYFHEASAADAFITSGIRAVAGQGVIDYPAPGVPDPKENIKYAHEFVREFKQASHLLKPSIFCHSPYTCSRQTLIEAKQAARQEDVLFQVHVAETKNEAAMVQGRGDLSVVQYLDSIGALDEQTLMVHSVWIDEADMEIISKSGAGVVHCPESNMKLASGIAPIPGLIEKGVPVGLGTDGAASNNDQDLFSEMDTAAKLHKVALLDPCIMDAQTCLQMTTIQGAKAVGLGELVGSIEKGKRADIILLDLKKPHMVPMYDPYSAVVYSARASDVYMTMVDGKIRALRGKIISN